MTSNITTVYSPDNDVWYLEDMNPDFWRISKDTYETEQEAWEALWNDKVKWVAT